MKRVHLVILLVVLLVLVLALFALTLNDRPLPPESMTKPGGDTATPTAPDAPPSGRLGREDQGIGTAGLPRAPAPLERP